MDWLGHIRMTGLWCLAPCTKACSDAGWCSIICPIRLNWWTMSLNSCSVEGNLRPNGCVNRWNCSALTPTALSNTKALDSTLKLAPPPSARARDLIVSKRVTRTSTGSFPLLWKWSKSWAARILISSSNGENLTDNPWMRNDTGSSCWPLTIPPWNISCGVRVRASSRAAPPNCEMIAAACLWGSMSLVIVHSRRPCNHVLKGNDVSSPGSHLGGSRCDWYPPPGIMWHTDARATATSMNAVTPEIAPMWSFVEILTGIMLIKLLLTPVKSPSCLGFTPLRLGISAVLVGSWCSAPSRSGSECIGLTTVLALTEAWFTLAFVGCSAATAMVQYARCREKNTAMRSGAIALLYRRQLRPRLHANAAQLNRATPAPSRAPLPARKTRVLTDHRWRSLFYAKCKRSLKLQVLRRK